MTFRRIENMGGGEGDPRSFAEWRKHHGGNFVSILIAVGVLAAIIFVGSALVQALD